MTKTVNTVRVREQVQKFAENAVNKHRGYVAVRIDVLDELLDTSDAFDELVRDCIESVRR